MGAYAFVINVPAADPLGRTAVVVEDGKIFAVLRSSRSAEDACTVPFSSLSYGNGIRYTSAFCVP